MFNDRVEAGKALAKSLSDYKGKKVVVFAIPRGGVVLAYEVAKALDAPLDLIIPRKIGAPNEPEFAIGAVTEDGTTILNQDAIQYLRVPDVYIQEEVKRQIAEIKRRMERYLGLRPRPSVEGKTVILVDDGVATGATIRAAIASIKKKKPDSIVLAIPVGPPDTIEELRKEADLVVCLMTPEPFFAIGQFYRRFEQLSDEEVVQIIDRLK
ncbi:MAG: phosphoribosyltransferase [Nitrososphaerales archaeon]|nr:phosphoribosyltransferase [Nitrososphaerales archaeon]